jgi:cellulose synthase/poly-beta-1,6-N-acetylglucosamine synthase-like glycosyltransferase
MKIAILVPTFRRPGDLRRCIAAIAGQRRLADQVVIVARVDDHPTQHVLAALMASGSRLDIVLVDRPGVVHALNSGLQAVAADVVAITDDDAAPHADWLEKLEGTFRSAPQVGGVGGRDIIRGLQSDGAERRAKVGKVQWFGRVIGNHHIGCGPPRSVDVLKGVNCAYRVEALRAVGFGEGLKGAGAQPHFELSIGLDLVKIGWTLIYDADILVDHYPGRRHDDDQRGVFGPQALSKEVHNETLVLLRHLSPLRRGAFAIWFLLCGTRSYPGLLCWLVEAAHRKPHISRRFLASLRGRALGVASWISERAQRPAGWIRSTEATPLR